MNTVFFVVPVYNVEKYLKRCIDSILSQTYKNQYVILVDDGSNDKSPEICDSYAEKYDHVEVIHKPNGGLSDARNAGLARCFALGNDSDFVVLLDSDDFVRDCFIERLVSICLENDCQIAQSNHEKGSRDTFSQAYSPGKVTVVDKRAALLGYRLKSQISPKLYRLKLFRNILFPKDVLNEDEFVIYRLVYGSEKVAFTDEVLFYYFQHSGSIMDEIAKKLKNNPHRYDWLYAYLERACFFEAQNEPAQVQRTYEKICTDIILRYTEQLRLKKEDRDGDVGNGQYIRTYRRFFHKMIWRKGLSVKKRLMYNFFYMFPRSARIAETFVPLRK